MFDRPNFLLKDLLTLDNNGTLVKKISFLTPENVSNDNLQISSAVICNSSLQTIKQLVEKSIIFKSSMFYCSARCMDL